MTKVCQKHWLTHHEIVTCHQVAHRRHAYDISQTRNCHDISQTRNGAEQRVCDVALKDRQSWC